MNAGGRAFGPDDLDFVERTFDHIWAALIVDPRHDATRDAEMKILLRNKLLEVVASGDVDDEDLKRIALECAALGS